MLTFRTRFPSADASRVKRYHAKLQEKARTVTPSKLILTASRLKLLLQLTFLNVAVKDNKESRTSQ